MAIRSKDSHHDDITNATMTATFVIRHEKLIQNHRNTPNPHENSTHLNRKQVSSEDQSIHSKQKIAKKVFFNIYNG